MNNENPLSEAINTVLHRILTVTLAILLLVAVYALHFQQEKTTMTTYNTTLE